MKPIERPDKAYYDLQALNQIKQESPQEALEQAAALFETHFLKTVLKHMRDATDALAADDSPFSSSTERFYRDMGDEQLAQNLSAQRQLGLAHMLVKQLGQTLPQDGEAVEFKSTMNKVALEETEGTPARADVEDGLAGYADHARMAGIQRG